MGKFSSDNPTMKPTPAAQLTMLIFALFMLALPPVTTAQDAESTDYPAPTETETAPPTETAAPTEVPATATQPPTETPPPTPTPTEPPTATELPTLMPTVTPDDMVIEATLEATPDAETPEATETPTAAPTGDATSDVTPIPTATETETALPIPAEPPMVIRLREDFDGGDLSQWRLGAGWTLVASENGQALQLSESVGAFQYIDAGLADVAVEARFLSAGATAQIIARQSADGNYSASLNANSVVELARSGQVLASAAVMPSGESQWRTLRLSVTGAALRVAVDGAEVIALVDENALSAGVVSIGGGGGGLLVDDVTIWQPPEQIVTPVFTATPLPTAAPAQPAAAEPLVSTQAEGTTYVVNVKTDGPLSCGTICTFEAAIAEANADPDVDTIVFNLSGEAPHVIYLRDELEIRYPVIIDGTTQPGYNGRPIIQIQPDPITAPPSSAIKIEPAMGVPDEDVSLTLRGLSIVGFPGSMIDLREGQNHVIEQNFIGVDTTLKPVAHQRGIWMTSRYNTVRDNRFAGATAAAIELRSDGLSNSQYNQISNNRILNNEVGILLYGTQTQHNLIGGFGEEDGNLISGNGIGIKFSRVQAGNNQVAGNRIGVNLAGSSAQANRTGILIEASSGNLIGGTDGTTPGGACTGACNVISGNNVGIEILGFANDEANPASGNVIEGNVIGVAANGNARIRNTDNGVVMTNAFDNVIRANVISGNERYGIFMTGGLTAGNRIEGNRIGTNSAGTRGVMNRIGGILIGIRAHDNWIGGTEAGAGNVIALNAGTGVFVQNGDDNRILGNQIYGNGGLGIDLSPTGQTANDSGDRDNGANDIQNAPVLNAVVTRDVTTVSGRLNSEASKSYRIEFFASASCDATGYGEGERFVGAADVLTNANGNANFNVTLSEAVASGEYITATATNPDGSTSEFSACAHASADLAISQQTIPNLALPNASLIYNLTVTNRGQSDASAITFTDTLPNGVTFVAANADGGSCTAAVNTVTCQIASIASGSSANVLIEVKVRQNAPSPLVNTARVTSVTHDPMTGNNARTLRTNIRQADLAITNIDRPDPVSVGGVIRYSLRVTNNGPHVATGVLVTDVLPEGLTPISAIGPSGATCSVVGRRAQCTLPPLANGSAATVTVRAQVSAGMAGTVRNTARVSTSARDSVSSNNRATATTQVNAP